MNFQQLKSQANRALDAAAGRELTFDERQDWWIAEARYLRAFTDDDQRAGILEEARAFCLPNQNAR